MPRSGVSSGWWRCHPRKIYGAVSAVLRNFQPLPQPVSLPPYVPAGSRVLAASFVLGCWGTLLGMGSGADQGPDGPCARICRLNAGRAASGAQKFLLARLSRVRSDTAHHSRAFPVFTGRFSSSSASAASPCPTSSTRTPPVSGSKSACSPQSSDCAPRPLAPVRWDGKDAKNDLRWRHRHGITICGWSHPTAAGKIGNWRQTYRPTPLEAGALSALEIQSSEGIASPTPHLIANELIPVDGPVPHCRAWSFAKAVRRHRWSIALSRDVGNNRTSVRAWHEKALNNRDSASAFQYLGTQQRQHNHPVEDRRAGLNKYADRVQVRPNPETSANNDTIF